MSEKVQTESKSGISSFLSIFQGKNQPPQTILEKVSGSSEKVYQTIEQSDFISRDLSWIQFNYRVLEQVKNPNKNLFERLKFLAISDSNLDEFFSIRVGSLYNYLDYHKERVDYSGLREVPFRKTLLSSLHTFTNAQDECYEKYIKPLFEENHFQIVDWSVLTENEKDLARIYFEKTIYPMLTPMLYDYTHTFPVLLPKTLIFAVVTKSIVDSINEDDNRKLSFVQIPQNLPRYFVIEKEDGEVLFVPIDEIVRHLLQKLYRNVEIISKHLFRIVRNGDFSTEDSDDVESDFIDEIKQKLKTRRLGRVVRIEIEPNMPEWLLNLLKKRMEIDDYNFFIVNTLLDFTSFWQIIKHPDFSNQVPQTPASILPLGVESITDIFDTIKEGDILLHHPFNNFEPVLQLIEQASEDPHVLAIKLTIYRLAKNSRITQALLNAAENGKHVSVLFEVKARFDEENNIREAQKLQKAGCFVIYGINNYKTHTKLLQVVRAEGQKVVSYSHLASGNYNEETAKLYTDIGLLTCDETYNHDITEFFNVITGHSLPSKYKYLITTPGDMRMQLIELIRNEAINAANGLPAYICIKINSLEDKVTIEELYKASQAGVIIKLIVRGICCLKPQRKGLSENIEVLSIVGNFLEHTRLFYFHNNGNIKIYGGSADIMVRSFDKRIESLFKMVNPKVKQQCILILKYNFMDNVNAFKLNDKGDYEKVMPNEGEAVFNSHLAFYNVSLEEVMNAKIFE